MNIEKKQYLKDYDSFLQHQLDKYLKTSSNMKIMQENEQENSSPLKKGHITTKI